MLTKMDKKNTNTLTNIKNSSTGLENSSIGWKKFLNRLSKFSTDCHWLNRLPQVKKILNRLTKFLNRLSKFLNRLPLVKKFLTRLLQFFNLSPLPSQVVPIIHTITYSPIGTNYIIFSIDKWIYIYLKSNPNYIGTKKNLII